MKKKLFMLISVLMLVVTFAFAAGQTEEVTSTTAAGGPQYGGKLTMAGFGIYWEPSSWDIQDRTWTQPQYYHPFQETLIAADIEKYGPRGSDKFGFGLAEYVPSEFLTGRLAESWEVSPDPLGVRFNIRPGVYWTGNEHIGMERRELTAYDVASSINRLREGPVLQNRFTYLPEKDACEALDRYTAFLHFNSYDGTWIEFLGYNYMSAIFAPESIEAGVADWRNQVGTGPFILTNHVVGSYVSYKRNPDYWRTAIIEGVEYELPFLDELVQPIIVDVETKVAALRTARMDWTEAIRMYYKDTLAQTSPDLIMQEYAAADLQILCFQSLIPEEPTYDKNVRRALMIGTDMQSIVDVIHFGHADMQSWPYNAKLPPSVYTSTEDLPPSTRELFVYDPDKAKQLIVEAGYPDGFSMDMEFIPTEVGGPDVAALLQDQWALIGVDLKLRPIERAIRNQLYNEGTWTGVLMRSTGNARPLIQMTGAVAPSPPNYFYHSDPWFVEKTNEAAAGMDLVKQAAILKELGVYYIDQAIEMSAGTPYFLNCYWPWVKNYYGEIDCGLQNQEPMLSLIWIDQDLKKEMGY